MHDRPSKNERYSSPWTLVRVGGRQVLTPSEVSSRVPTDVINVLPATVWNAKDLLFEVQDRIRPQFCVFGHIHEGAGATRSTCVISTCFNHGFVQKVRAQYRHKIQSCSYQDQHIHVIWTHNKIAKYGKPFANCYLPIFPCPTYLLLRLHGHRFRGLNSIRGKWLNQTDILRAVW